ncbi:MAG: GNAT family N-acetyltransferase [Acidimicrobiales bacterium]
MSEEIFVRKFWDLTAAQFHEILRLRIDVFVVEQSCPYPELDGADRDDATLHYWTEDAEGITAYLRTLKHPRGRRIGRVVTASRRRSEGLAAALMERVLKDERGFMVLSAQSYLQEFYERFGFAAEGEEYLEDEIPHIDMVRSA